MYVFNTNHYNYEVQCFLKHCLKLACVGACLIENERVPYEMYCKKTSVYNTNPNQIQSILNIYFWFKFHYQIILVLLHLFNNKRKIICEILNKFIRFESLQ